MYDIDITNELQRLSHQIERGILIHDYVIETENEVKAFIYGCIFVLKLDFNPGMDFNLCYHKATNLPLFTWTQARELNNALQQCIKVCNKLQLDIQDITSAILTKHSN
jgi:hypothetical protein